MAAQKSRLKGSGHGGVTGMLTASIAPSSGCLAQAMAAAGARRSATRLKAGPDRRQSRRREPGSIPEQQRDQT